MAEVDESRILGGHARSLAEAEAWLRQIGGIVAAHPERLAPAMLSLSAMNALFLEGVSRRTAAELRKFFDFVERRCADARYATVQEKFLNSGALRRLVELTPPNATDLVAPEKYLYLPFWAASKLKIADGLGLRDHAPRAILDLGSGPGHFALACEYLGHTCWGLDIPFRSSASSNRPDLYGELFDAFGLHRMIHRITAYEPVPVPRRFDMVTSQMGLFCTNPARPRPVPWKWSEWRYFLRDLVEHVVAPRFEVRLGLNREYLAAEAIERMTGVGLAFDPARHIIQFTHAHADAILAAPE